jgi:hypothetical protein
MGGDLTMRRFLFAGAFALAASYAHALPASFDGEWSVDARTSVGDCQPEVAGTVTIQGGHVVAASGASIAAWGYIEDNGDISARFTQGQAMLRAQGKLKGKAGSGAWSSNTNYCGGKWTAHRAD